MNMQRYVEVDKLVQSILSLLKIHLNFKTKFADVGDKEDEIYEIIDNAAEKLAFQVMDIVGEAEMDIDKVMEKLNEEEENRIERQRNFNVYKLRKRGDL